MSQGYFFIVETIVCFRPALTWKLNLFSTLFYSFVDVTTFLYFSAFAPLIYLTFLKGFFGFVFRTISSTIEAALAITSFWSLVSFLQLRAEDPFFIQVPSGRAGREWRPSPPNHCCHNGTEGADRPGSVLLLHPDWRLWSRQLPCCGSTPRRCCLRPIWVQQY